MKIASLARTLSACLLVSCAAAPAAQACSAEPFAAFYDDFKKPNPQWQADGSSIYFADGQLAIKAAAGRNVSTSIPSYRFNNAVICLDVKGPAARVASSTSGAGLVFGKTDNSNYFLVALYESGTYLFAQLANNAWRTIDSNNHLKKFNVGPGAVNEIKVRLRPLATRPSTLDTWIMINDEIVTQPDMPILAGGGMVGVYAESAADNAGEWRFLDISATPQSMNPEGTYNVTGTDGSGTGYAGTAYVWRYIYKNDDIESYTVTWDVNGKKTNGTGMLRGNELSVSYTDGSAMGAAVLGASGSGWTAKRVNAGSGARLATETWVRK